MNGAWWAMIMNILVLCVCMCVIFVCTCVCAPVDVCTCICRCACAQMHAETRDWYKVSTSIAFYKIFLRQYLLLNMELNRSGKIACQWPTGIHLYFSYTLLQHYFQRLMPQYYWFWHWFWKSEYRSSCFHFKPFIDNHLTSLLNWYMIKLLPSMLT